MAAQRGIWSIGEDRALTQTRWRSRLTMPAIARSLSARSIERWSDRRMAVTRGSRSARGRPAHHGPSTTSPCPRIIRRIARSLRPGRASGACRPVKRCGNRRRRAFCPPPTSTRLRSHPTTPQVTRCWPPRSAIKRLHVASGVFRSDDGGVNWQPSDSGLPDGELRSIAFSPHYADDHTVYLASTQQLYRSIDDGHSWIAVGCAAR